MTADLSDRLGAPPAAPPRPLDAAFAARPRLLQLRDALARAAATRPRWGEPPVFFFDPRRQAELDAARPAIPDRLAGVAALIECEMPGLLASVEVRRVARALGLQDVARSLAARSPAANELAELLAVPDDEVFLALVPADFAGVRLHVRGAESVGQLHRLLSAALKSADFQLFSPGALGPGGTLPEGFAGCAHWLWPTQPLAAVPRVNGERVVLVGPATVRPSPEVEVRFPALAVECELVESLTPARAAGELSRLCGRPVSLPAAVEGPAVARAA